MYVLLLCVVFEISWFVKGGDSLKINKECSKYLPEIQLERKKTKDVNYENQRQVKVCQWDDTLN